MSAVPFLASMMVLIEATALAQAMHVDVEVDITADGAARFFDDGDIDLDCHLVTAAGNVVPLSLTPLVAVDNRGNNKARYYRCTVDLTVATGTNLAAGIYELRVFPGASQWTQTHPDTGQTKNRSTADVSMLAGRLDFEAIAVLVKNQYSFTR